MLEEDDSAEQREDLSRAAQKRRANTCPAEQNASSRHSLYAKSPAAGSPRSLPPTPWSSSLSPSLSLFASTSTYLNSYAGFRHQAHQQRRSPHSRRLPWIISEAQLHSRSPLYAALCRPQRVHQCSWSKAVLRRQGRRWIAIAGRLRRTGGEPWANAWRDHSRRLFCKHTAHSPSPQDSVCCCHRSHRRIDPQKEKTRKRRNPGFVWMI